MRSAMTMIVSVSLVFLVESPAFAERFPLRGMLKVANGPVPVRIRLEKLGMTIREVFLHEDWFEFSDVEEGVYTLVAAAPGYETLRQDIVVPGEFPLLELRPQRSAAAGRPEAVPAWDLKIPGSARREFAAGQKKVRENNCVDGLGHFRKAIQSYTAYGDAHRAMGECYFGMAQLGEAEQEFKAALEQPHAAELHLLLGKVYARQSKEGLMTRQLELYVSEEKPGPLRDRVQAALSDRRENR